jgi:5-formyltetrahydrofolate cyclo-ligase
MNKAALREKHLRRRKDSDPVLTQAASFQLQEKLWIRLKDVQTIGIYVSMDKEVQTVALIEALMKAGKTVCVPKIVNKTMIFVRLRNFGDCTLSSYGILEPVSNEPFAGQIEVQVVPMLAFNERKFRLGYGKGYYDTYLRDFKGLKLGICFSQDYDNDLIETDYDVALDEILTEQ